MPMTAPLLIDFLLSQENTILQLINSWTNGFLLPCVNITNLIVQQKEYETIQTTLLCIQSQQATQDV